MITIIYLRDKCIGCNYCAEIAPMRWVMSKKDGRSVLLGAGEKRGRYLVKVHDGELELNQRAAEACPARVIRISGQASGDRHQD